MPKSFKQSLKPALIATLLAGILAPLSMSLDILGFGFSGIVAPFWVLLYTKLEDLHADLLSLMIPFIPLFLYYWILISLYFYLRAKKKMWIMVIFWIILIILLLLSGLFNLALIAGAY